MNFMHSKDCSVDGGSISGLGSLFISFSGGEEEELISVPCQEVVRKCSLGH